MTLHKTANNTIMMGDKGSGKNNNTGLINIMMYFVKNKVL